MNIVFMSMDTLPSTLWARDLYDQMHIRSDFRKWFPRMCQYGFIEGRDYEYMPRVRLQDEGGRTVQRYVKDYRITQDMAKKLCKLHHTAVGAAYHPQPFDWDALLGLLHKKPPRRSSYEAQLSESNSLVTTTQIAKEYGCGAKVFNRLLHLHGIQYRVNGQWVLYSEHHGKGYTSSLTFRLQRSDGSEVEKLHTAWTQKGRKFLYHTLKRRGVLPLAEQGGYVPEHHEAIVSPEIARAAHLVASSSKKCGVQDIVVIRQGALKGFVGIHPNWSGINAESIRSLCLSTYLPEEVMKLNDIAEMRAGATLGKALQSEYMTVSGTCFINQSSPVMTISKNGIRFSKACHSRLDDCEYVELLYHPILQVVILRKSNHGFSTAMHWRDDNDVHSVFSARAFSGLVFQTLNWKMNYRYQCRGICRGQGNAKFLIFELDESRILTGKNQYEQENCSMNLKCRLYRSKWVQSITVNDVMESGQVVENPMIGAIPSKNEVQRELDDLLMSM